MTEMKIEDLPEKYHARVEAAIKELLAVLAAYEEQPDLVNDFTAVDFTRKQRWDLHVLACSFSDFTFWIERKDGRYRDRGRDGRHWRSRGQPARGDGQLLGGSV